MQAMFDQLPFGGGASVGLVPSALNGGVNNAAWAAMRDVNKFLNALIATNQGTAGDDIVVSLQQATDSSGTGAKVLNIDTERVFYKVGDPISPDVFTALAEKGEGASVASVDTDSLDSAENDFLMVVRIRPLDLDVENGFSHVRVVVAQTTNAQNGAVLYVPDGAAYSGDGATGVIA